MGDPGKGDTIAEMDPLGLNSGSSVDGNPNGVCTGGPNCSSSGTATEERNGPPSKGRKGANGGDSFWQTVNLISAFFQGEPPNAVRTDGTGHTRGNPAGGCETCAPSETANVLYNVAGIVPDMGLSMAGTLLALAYRAAMKAKAARQIGEAMAVLSRGGLQRKADAILDAADDIGRSQRTVAVAEDANGRLWAGSSRGGFSRSQKQKLEELGITPVPTRKNKKRGGYNHAEENLVDELGNKIERMGTTRAPCSGHKSGADCASLVEEQGIFMDNR